VLALPYDSGTVDEIYAGHLLEHLPFSDGKKALSYWHDLLRDGGRIAISVPDYDVIAAQYLEDPSAEKLREMNDIYIYSEHQESHHRYMYSGLLLEEVMRTAGFVDLERMALDHPYFPLAVPWQVGFTARKRAHASL
jgi:predicted SAM-dependent methyltransferase